MGYASACAPTPTSPSGAPVPRLLRHPALRTQGTIHQRRPNPHPINAKTHQPDRQFGPQKRRLAVPRPPARTWTQPRRAPLSQRTPRRRTCQGTGSQRRSHIRRGGQRQHGPKRRRRVVARKHWHATWEASPGRHPYQMAKPGRRRQKKTTQPRHIAPPAQLQREGPTVDTGAGATEDAEGRPQRKEEPVPTAELNARGPPRAEIPSRVTGKPGSQHAGKSSHHPPDMAAHESSEAPDTGQPATGLWGPTPGAGQGADPPSTARPGGADRRHAGAAPCTAPAHRSDTGTPGDAASGEAQTQVPPQAHEESNTRATCPNPPKRATDTGPSPGEHSRDDDSFDAFPASCRSAPQTDPAPTAPRSHLDPRGDHTEPARDPPREPLAVSRQAHLQCDYAALGARTEHTAATDDGDATASGAADQTPDEPPQHSAQGSGTRVETTPTPLGSLPNSHRGPPQPGDGGMWTTRAQKATPAAPTPTRNRRWPKTWTGGSPGSPQGSGSPRGSASDGCLPQATSRMEPAPWRTLPSAIGKHRTHPPPPWSTSASGTTWPPGSWRIWGPIARMK